MKTAVIKKSTIAFITFVLALAFALVGCGGFTANPEEPFLGSWKISGGELEGEDFDEETLDAMEDWGINCILIFEEDGEGQIDLYNHVSDITWKIEDDGTAKIKADGASFKATLKDGELTLKESKNRIVFTKSKKDLSGTVKKDREATEKARTQWMAAPAAQPAVPRTERTLTSPSLQQSPLPTTMCAPSPSLRSSKTDGASLA